MKNQKKINYYAGCSANYLDPEGGISAIRLLEENGYQVTLPEMKCCGLPHLANGKMSTFRKLAFANIKRLNSIEGEIVTTCTSCDMILKRDYPEFIKTPEAEQVAERTIDIIDFLEREGILDKIEPDSSSPVKHGLYHAPCHLKAAGHEAIEKRIHLLNRLPGLQVTQIDRGCCGMGGTFGMKATNYKNSLSIASHLIKGIEEANPDFVITDCPGCKMQLDQGVDQQITHPVILIEEAFNKQKKQ